MQTLWHLVFTFIAAGVLFLLLGPPLGFYAAALLGIFMGMWSASQERS